MAAAADRQSLHKQLLAEASQLVEQSDASCEFAKKHVSRLKKDLLPFVAEVERSSLFDTLQTNRITVQNIQSTYDIICSICTQMKMCQNDERIIIDCE